MAVGYPPRDDTIFPPLLDQPVELFGRGRPLRIDGLALALLLLLGFLAFQLLTDQDQKKEADVPFDPSSSTSAERAGSVETAPPAPPPDVVQDVPVPPLPDPALVVYPYDTYWITQGPHGMAYGHMAIDLAAGKGTPVKSPIHGQVTGNYVDQYGNTTLIIENERYQVILLHGDYSAAVGQAVAAGDVIGSENNHGYTTDMAGQSCRDRDCGYHTHLNLFDKTLGQNVNPLDILVQ